MVTKKKATKKRVSKKKIPAKKVTKRKVAKKVPTRKKPIKKLKEEEFDIKLKSDNPTMVDYDDTVNADSVEELFADVDSEEYDQVTVKKSATRGSKPNTAPDSAVINSKPDGIGESVDSSRYSYPYNMSLPMGFKKLIMFSLQESVNTMRETGGRFTVSIMNKKQMESLVKRLGTQSDNPLSRTIIEGIARSAK